MSDTCPCSLEPPGGTDLELLLYRARAIYCNNRGQLTVWAALYMLLLFGPVAAGMFAWAPGGKLACGIARLMLAPLLMGMYAWLHGIISGSERAHAAFFHPIRWVKTRSLWRFLTLAAAVAAATYIQMRFVTAADRLLVSGLGVPLNEIARQVFGRENLADTAFLLIPLFDVPVFLIMQWVVDFYCIHAVQTDGQRAWGLIGSRSAIMGGTARLEARLMRRALWVPYAVYYGAYILSQILAGPAEVFSILACLMFFTFLGFGLSYYPQSAIARSLMMLNQPRLVLVPAEPVDFREIDEKYAALVKARDARRGLAAESPESEADDENEADDEDGAAL